jgi:hypothetical protein
MKKILLLLFFAALAACGGRNSNTTENSNITASKAEFMLPETFVIDAESILLLPKSNEKAKKIATHTTITAVETGIVITSDFSAKSVIILNVSREIKPATENDVKTYIFYGKTRNGDAANVAIFEDENEELTVFLDLNNGETSIIYSDCVFAK